MGLNGPLSSSDEPGGRGGPDNDNIGDLVGCWGLTQYQHLWSCDGESNVGNIFSL